MGLFLLVCKDDSKTDALPDRSPVNRGVGPLELTSLTQLQVNGDLNAQSDYRTHNPQNSYWLRLRSVE